MMLYLMGKLQIIPRVDSMLKQVKVMLNIIHRVRPKYSKGLGKENVDV